MSRSEHEAGQRARKIIELATIERHAHMVECGLDDDFMVWRPDENNNLVIVPAYRSGCLAGCQLINRNGARKMTRGTLAGVTHTLGNKGGKIYCVSYEDGVLIHKLMASIKMQCQVVVCFDSISIILPSALSMSIYKNGTFDLHGHDSFVGYIKAVGKIRAIAALSRCFRLHQFDEIESWHIEAGATILALSNAADEMREHGACTAAIDKIIYDCREKVKKYVESKVR